MGCRNKLTLQDAEGIRHLVMPVMVISHIQFFVGRHIYVKHNNKRKMMIQRLCTLDEREKTKFMY